MGLADLGFVDQDGRLGTSITKAFDALRDLSKAGKPAVDADFRVHPAIAQPANNTRLVEFLRLIGIAMTPRQVIGDQVAAPADDRIESGQPRYRQFLRNLRRWMAGGRREQRRPSQSNA